MLKLKFDQLLLKCNSFEKTKIDSYLVNVLTCETFSCLRWLRNLDRTKSNLLFFVVVESYNSVKNYKSSRITNASVLRTLEYFRASSVTKLRVTKPRVIQTLESYEASSVTNLRVNQYNYSTVRKTRHLEQLDS